MRDEIPDYIVRAALVEFGVIAFDGNRKGEAMRAALALAKGETGK
jgi:hypothetical protein